MDDFHSDLHEQDKLGGAGLNQSSIRDFESCLQQANLMELNLIGDRLTWENGRVKEKLDIAISNLDWFFSFGNQGVENLLKFGSDSDHRAIYVQTAVTNGERRRRKQFKGHAAWMLSDSFGDVAWKDCNWVEGSMQMLTGGVIKLSGVFLRLRGRMTCLTNYNYRREKNRIKADSSMWKDKMGRNIIRLLPKRS